MNKSNDGISTAPVIDANSVQGGGSTIDDRLIRKNTTFTRSHIINDPEVILTKKYGAKFVDYRSAYKKSLNYDVTGFIPDFPLTVTLELVNRCNLSCIMCYTINHSEKKRTLVIGDIERVLKECEDHNLPALVVGLGSEPLLYKEIKTVLGTALDAGVMDIFLGTNGVLLTEDLSEYLVRRQVARLEISLDAVSSETYQKIRGKDELDRIEENIKRFIEIRKRHNSELPVLRVCFCVQELNYKEIEEFRNKWKDKADYIDFQQVLDFSDVDSFRDGDKICDSTSGSSEQPISTHCAYPFNSLNIWSNGNVTPCCTFYAKSEELVLGNIRESTLGELWSGERIKELRTQLLSGQPSKICRACLTNRNTEHFNSVKVK